MHIHFTNNSTLTNFEHFLSGVSLSDPTKLEITTDPRWVNTHPAGIVFAAALANLAGKGHSTIDDNISKSGAYLDRMGLYNYLSTKSHFVLNEKEASGRFIPIQNVKTPDEQTRFVTDMIPLLHLDSEKSKAIRYVVSELIRNVLEHSLSASGAFVAAQYYPRKNKISIGICDTGIGLKSSLSKYHFVDNDLDAIRLALMPGVSGATSRPGGAEENGGAGLFIIKSMARITRNYFLIYSGDSDYKLRKYDRRTKTPRIYADPFDDTHTARSNLPNFQGTLVGIDISLSESEEFNNLLESIKKVYSKALYERKRKAYRKPIYR